jgi:hypothetical protein
MLRALWALKCKTNTTEASKTTKRHGFSYIAPFQSELHILLSRSVSILRFSNKFLISDNSVSLYGIFPQMISFRFLGAGIFKHL